MQRGLARISIIISIIFLSSLPSRAGAELPVPDVWPPLLIAPQGEQLRLAACASAPDLWMDAFAMALYLPDLGLQANRILETERAKAVRLYPVHEGELPQTMPEAWREQLKSHLSPPQIEMARQLYARMSKEDVITLAYRPGQGSLVMLNDTILGKLPDDTFIRAVLATWIRPNPEGEGRLLYHLNPGC